MAIHRVMHFTITGENNFVLKQILDDELFTIKRYLFKVVATTDTEVRFKFDTTYISDGFVQIFENPIVSENGAPIVSQPTALNIFSEPTVTNEGTFFYSADPKSTLIKVHVLTLLANTDYLIKINPRDANDILLT